MKVITYLLTLLEPTLVTALEGDPNEGVAFDYLPGSVLRGAVIAKYLRANNLTDIDAADANMKRLFLDGTTRYLNGYPLDRLGERTLPTPQSWQREKGNETDIFDFAVEILNGDEKQCHDKQWQGVDKPFCSLAAQDRRQVCLVKPDRHIAVHTARTRRFGRAMPEDKIDASRGDTRGAVFRYDALAPGQTFQSIILCYDNDAANLKSLLTGEAKLGGSRSGGYGQVRFEVVREEASDGWGESGGNFAADLDGKLIITLLSDTLLRDKNGQFVVDTDVVTAALSAQLGVALSPYKYPNESEPRKWAYICGEPIGGFNRKWGLPLTQVLAIQMGSVFVYDSPTCNISKLNELEAKGIGERRAEGFGRVAVNWHTEPELRVDTTKPSAPLAKLLTPGTDSEKLAQRMAERLLRQRLDERLVAKANANDVDITNPPSNAQLSRMRSIIHDELMKEIPNPQRVGEFLNRVRERSTARKQFEQARVGSMPLLKWLDDTLQATAESEWKTLLGFQSSDIRKVGGVQASLSDSVRVQYVLRLVYAVLARAAKERRKEAR